MPLKISNIRVLLPILFTIILIFLILPPIRFIPKREFYLQASLASPDPRIGGFFGWSISASSQYVVVREAKLSTCEEADMSHVYLFDLKTLKLKGKYSCPNPRRGFYATQASAVDSDVILTCRHWDDVDGKRDAGRVYVYDAETYKLRAILKSPNPQIGGFFGWSAALSPKYIIIGELRGFASGVKRAGKVYVYDKKTLSLMAELSSPDPKEWAGFGSSVAASSDIIAVGEAWASVNRVENAGRICIFDASTYDLEAVITSPDPQENAVFGYSIAVARSNAVIVGEPKADVNDIRMAGRVHIYRYRVTGQAVKLNICMAILDSFIIATISAFTAIYQKGRKQI